MELKEFYDRKNDREFLELTFNARDQIECKLVRALYNAGMRVTLDNLTYYLELHLKKVLDEGYSPLYDVSIADVVDKHLKSTEGEREQYEKLLTNVKGNILTEDRVLLLSRYIFYKTVLGEGGSSCAETYRDMLRNKDVNMLIDSLNNEYKNMSEYSESWLKMQASMLKEKRLDRCNIPIRSSEKKRSELTERCNGNTEEFNDESKFRTLSRRSNSRRNMSDVATSIVRHPGIGASNLPVIASKIGYNKELYIANKYKKSVYTGNTVDNLFAKAIEDFNRYKELIVGRY